MAFSQAQLLIAQVSLAVAGIIVQLYALHIVDLAKSADADSEALCDLGEHVSCTKFLASEYGTFFGLSSLIGEDSAFNLPNSYFAIGFYALVIAGAILRSKGYLNFLYYAAIGKLLGCVYLSVIMFKTQNVCLVCAPAFAINGLLFATIKTRRAASTTSTASSKKKQ